MIDEAKGSIYYGIHFYPGLAQYNEGKNKEPYRVFLDENTLRKMDPSFAGRPVFVSHVDEIEPNINELRKEADGWVIESFFNQADGKHWVKFIVVSELGEEAIKRGMKLSNCYVPRTFGARGVWNGIDYDREITDGVYEHLAIVPNPRYEESVIMTPEEFKKHNEEKISELKKLANHNNNGEGKMKFSFFKRSKVENSADLEGMSVMLPKSNAEVAIAKLINDADEAEMHKDKPKIAEPHHLVDYCGNTMTVNDLVQKCKAANDALEEMKKKKEDSSEEGKESEEEGMKKDASEDQDMETAKKEVPKPDMEKASEKQTLKLEKEEEQEVKDSKKQNAMDKGQINQAHFDRLKNAEKNVSAETVPLNLSEDRVARGKSLYGSK